MLCNRFCPASRPGGAGRISYGLGQQPGWGDDLTQFDGHIPHVLDECLVTNRAELGLMLPTQFELSQNSRFSHYKFSFFINIPDNDRVLIQLAPYSLNRSFARIDYRPSHFDAAATNLVAAWLHIIFKEYYSDFLSKALVSRVDWAIDLLGLDFGKLFWTVSHSRKGKVIHNDSTSITESSYAGGNSSKIIWAIYNKFLQLECRKLPQLYPGYRDISRVELRLRFCRADQITLAKLAKIDLHIDRAQFFYVDCEPSNHALREIHNDIKTFGLFCVLKQLTKFDRDMLLEHLRPHAIFPLELATEERAFSKEVDAKLKPFFAQLHQQ